MSRNVQTNKFEVFEVEGVNFETSELRILGIIDSEDEKFLNVRSEYEKAEESVLNGIRYAIQVWMQGKPMPKRHHGWDVSAYGGKYTSCYVFKHTAKQVRVYGYLFHPSKNSRIVICCLMHFTTKNEHETDESILDDLVRVGSLEDAKSAVEKFFVENLDKKEE